MEQWWSCQLQVEYGHSASRQSIYNRIINPLRPKVLDVLTHQNSFNRKYCRRHLFTLVSVDLTTKLHHDTRDSTVQGYSTAIWLHMMDPWIMITISSSKMVRESIQDSPITQDNDLLEWSYYITLHSRERNGQGSQTAASIYSLFTTTSRLLQMRG